tara:strand:+ start:7016 stop:7219 length:204 start_codon:yes stop_codon:yes gene_type:complete
MLKIKIISKSDNVEYSDEKYFGGVNGNKAVLTSYEEAEAFDYTVNVNEKLEEVKSKENVTNCYLVKK